MRHTDPHVRLDLDASHALVAWSRALGHDGTVAATALPGDVDFECAFAAERVRARRLGASVVRRGERSLVTFGFWGDDLHERRVSDDSVRLELYLLHADADLTRAVQRVACTRLRLPLARDGGYLWAAVEGLPVGARERVGALYWLVYRGEDGRWRGRPDPVGASYPFGAYAPAEVYDVASMHEHRADAAFFRRFAAGDDPAAAPRRFEPPVNVLQLHVGTATRAGTIAGLTRLVRRVAMKIRAGEPLTPFERCFSVYDAIQPLPLEPTIERERGPEPWTVQGVVEPSDPDAPCPCTVVLRRPDVTNWGYDVAFVGMSATNAALLESGRPDELVDLTAALHTFPSRPIMLILDLVYGHTDDQALTQLAPAFFRGPNMYGQDVNQQHPTVRAIMLEMQRRRVDVGADGIRVDGAQDLKVFDPTSGALTHDDDFLQHMGDLDQMVAGARYRPFCIFEDGRPWPREDWPTASTYRDVTLRQPHVFQWGPLTFAHNTPALTGFWWDRWWRVEEILAVGDRWVSGCANHDTVRRGTQLDPDGPINRRLGATLPQVLRRAYDHPAGTLLTYVAFPGLPMDFLNATARAPWGFVRDTDQRYAIKVAAEEAGFLAWQVEPDAFATPGVFTQLEALGFTTLAPLQRLFRALEREVQAGTDLEEIARRVTHLVPDSGTGPVTVATLERIARAFMADAVAWCNVERHAAAIDDAATLFGERVRALRHTRPWLREALRPGEWCRPERRDGITLVDAVRRAPGGGERLWLIANLEGDDAQLDLRARAPDGAPTWRVLLASPGALLDEVTGRCRLPDGEGVVMVAR